MQSRYPILQLAPSSWSWRVLVATVFLAVAAQAEYDFGNEFYNQQLLSQVDDALRPWQYEKDEGQDRRERPRFRHMGGVLVARWYPAARGEAPQYQWNWEMPPGVNQTARLWWRPYYPEYYRPYYRYCRYGYCRYYRRSRGYGYGYGYGGREYRRNTGFRSGYGGGGGYRRDARRYGRITASAVDHTVTPSTVTAPLTARTTRASNDGTPDDDAEEISVSNDIVTLPTITEEHLGGTDERPGYIPFQEQVCCGRYEEASLLKQDSIREQCYRQWFNTSSPQPGNGRHWNQLSCNSVQDAKEKIQCVHQCVWRLRGTFGDEKRVSLAKLRHYYKSTETQEWREDILDKAVTKCFTEYEDKSRDSGEAEKCTSDHLDLSFCLWEELQGNCPEQEWNTKSQYCNQLRADIRLRRRSS